MTFNKLSNYCTQGGKHKLFTYVVGLESVISLSLLDWNIMFKFMQLFYFHIIKT